MNEKIDKKIDKNNELNNKNSLLIHFKSILNNSDYVIFKKDIKTLDNSNLKELVRVLKHIKMIFTALDKNINIQLLETIKKELNNFLLFCIKSKTINFENCIKSLEIIHSLLIDKLDPQVIFKQDWKYFLEENNLKDIEIVKNDYIQKVLKNIDDIYTLKFALSFWKTYEKNLERKIKYIQLSKFWNIESLMFNQLETVAWFLENSMKEGGYEILFDIC